MILAKQGKVNKLLIIIGFLFSFLFLQEKVEADSNLREINTNSRLILTTATQYTDKVFLLEQGQFINNNYSYRVSLNSDGKISEIIPPTEFEQYGVVPNFHILADTDTKWYLHVTNFQDKDYIYIIDKRTNTVTKKSPKEFYGSFFQELENYGYKVDDFNFNDTQLYFNKEEELVWVKTQVNTYSQNTYNMKTEIIVANNQGKFKIGGDKGGLTSEQYLSDVNIDQYGNLFYLNRTERTIVKIDLQGNEKSFNLPNGQEYGECKVDLQGRFYLRQLADYALHVYKIEGDSLKEEAIITSPIYNLKLDNEGRFWYFRFSEDTTHLIYGYLDNNLNLVDVYVYNNYDSSISGDNYSIYNNELLIFSNFGFGTSFQEPLKKPLVDEITDQSRSVSGSAEAGKTVYVEKDGYVISSALVGQNGRFTVPISQQQSGTFLDIFVSDQKGNFSKSTLSTVVHQTGKGWIKINDTWYFYSNTGILQTGWVKSGGYWYYLDKNGVMQTGWVMDGKTWYYLNNSGAMATGWLKSGTSWYYLGSNGAMKTGWVTVGTKWYYLYANGKMAYSTKIGGYRLGSDGAWIK